MLVNTKDRNCGRENKREITERRLDLHETDNIC